MNDRLTGTSYDNPIWHRGYRIFCGPAYTRDSAWEFVHDEFDGAPTHSGDGPADERHGMGATMDHCKAQIDEIEESQLANRKRDK